MTYYVELISYFCTNTKTDYEAMASTYLENVMALINEGDMELLNNVMECINAIFNRLEKES